MEQKDVAAKRDDIFCLAAVPFKMTQNDTAETMEISKENRNSWSLFLKVIYLCGKGSNLECFKVIARMDHCRERDI